jgi:hypothetical protein
MADCEGLHGLQLNCARQQLVLQKAAATGKAAMGHGSAGEEDWRCWFGFQRGSLLGFEYPEEDEHGVMA